tara:strand:+ start:24311 stop:24424 length:114 start_codon:yes stop_codon:yes gene_type:complete
MTTVNFTAKYVTGSTTTVRQKPEYNFEFPKSLVVVIE